MQTSDAIDQLATALASAQGEITNAVKDSPNPFFKSTYADLAAVWDACRPALSKYGLAVIQAPTTAQGDNGAVEVTVETTLVHRSGQWVKSALSVWVQKADCQAIGSALTYLRRYSVAAICGVAPSGDDDAEAAVGRGDAVKSSTPKLVPAPEPMPPHYDEWLGKLKATAKEGTNPLQAFWKDSPAVNRSYLLKTNAKTWDAIKAHAQQVSPATATPTVVS